MDADDVFNPKVAIAVALTAALTSPPVRKAVRRGAVYGLAGVLMAGDRLASLANTAMESAQDAAKSAQEATGMAKKEPAEQAE